jgi:hypothetical protein
MTTENHQLTTFSPQKTIQKNAQERATPVKTGDHHAKKSPQKLAVTTDS